MTTLHEMANFYIGKICPFLTSFGLLWPLGLLTMDNTTNIMQRSKYFENIQLTHLHFNSAISWGEIFIWPLYVFIFVRKMVVCCFVLFVANVEILSPWAGGLRASSLRPQVYMTLTWTHSALKPLGAKNCMGVLKKSGKSSLMKRVLNFTRNPKLAHILVW